MNEASASISRFVKRLLPLAAVAVVFPVLVPCWVVVLPRLAFDVDPRTPGADVVTTLGPAAFGWLACFGVFSSLVAIMLHVLAGGAVRWCSVLLVVLGVVFPAAHAPASFDNLWHGLGWVWGAMAALAALHAAQWPEARRWMTLLLAGLAGALAVEAVYYVCVEHPETIRQFERQRDEFLTARGWEAGSSEATLYERRLRTNDAVGAFGLSNVLGTLAAGLSVLGWGVATVLSTRVIRSLASREGVQLVSKRWSCVAVGMTVWLAGLVALWLTNSAAAMLAWLMGLTWVALAVLVLWWGARHQGAPDDARPLDLALAPRLLASAAVVMVGLVYLAVLVRGWIGPPTPDQVGHGLVGERSVLFRFHYWEAAGRMLAEHWHERGFAGLLLPGAGLGPDGFGRAYLIHKNPINPEEVTNAHAAFVDYPVMLGLGGVAWSSVMLVWLWQGARSVLPPSANESDAETSPVVNARVLFYGVLGLALLLFGGEAIVVWPEVQSLGPMVMRLAAAVALVGVAVAWGRFVPPSSRALQVGLVGGSVAVLAHGQFDMGFFQPTSAPVLWLIVGLCGAGASRRGEAANAPSTYLRRWFPLLSWKVATNTLLSLFLLLVALASLLAAQRLTTYERLAGEAAALVRTGDLEEAAERAGAASRVVGLDRPTITAATRLDHERALAALSRGDQERATVIWSESLTRLLIATSPTQRGKEPTRWAWAARLASEVQQSMADHAAFQDQFDYQADAIALRRLAAARSPYSLADTVWLAETNQRLGHSQLAAVCAEAALELDAQRYLDPGKQLDDATRARMQAIVDRASGIE